MGSKQRTGVAHQVDFDVFVTERSPALLRAAWLLTGDWALARDLVQTALAKSWRRWEAIRGEDPEPYVRKVMTTTYVTWWRRRWRGEQPTAHLPDTAAVEDRYAAVDERQRLLAALAALPRRQRAVMVLRYFEDLTEAQTAERLGCAVGAVKSQTSKALTTRRAHDGLRPTAAEEVAG